MNSLDAEILNRQTTGDISIERLRKDLYHRSKANNPDYRRPDPRHFYLVSPVLSLIRNLSEELTPYE